MVTDLPVPVPENSMLTIVAEAASARPVFGTRRETRAFR